MRPLKRLKGASTGTFSWRKVTMIVLLVGSMLGFPAAPATRAVASAVALTINAIDLVIAVAPCRSGTPPGQYSFERRVTIDEVVLQGRGGVQQHDPEQRPGEEAMNLRQLIGQFLILMDQIGQLPELQIH